VGGVEGGAVLRGGVLGVRRGGAGAGGGERAAQEGREGLDVRAHDDDVPQFEGGIVLEEAEDHLAQHVHLPVAAVAGVHLEGVVRGGGAGCGGGPVRREVLLERGEERARAGGDGEVLVRGS